MNHDDLTNRELRNLERSAERDRRVEEKRLEERRIRAAERAAGVPDGIDP